MSTLPTNELLQKLNTLHEKQAKSNIERIISSYRHTWDIFTELIQNSADAIIEEFGFDNIYKGTIFLEVNKSTREIIIKDNGCGIYEKDLSSILVTGESLKRKNDQGKYGFMGFGLTFIAFQTSHFKIVSVKEKVKSSRTYNDLYKFIYEDSTLRTSEEEIIQKKPEETSEENGTTIILQFPTEFPDDSIESNIETAFNYTNYENLFEAILRTRTAVGLLDTIFEDKENFQFNLKLNQVDIAVQNKYLTAREVIKTIFPDEARVYDIEDYKKTIIKISENFPEQQKENTRQSVLIDSFVRDIEIGTRGKIHARLHISATSKNNINRYNENYLRKNELNDENGYEFSNGIWLSINGLPTGVCLDSFEHGNYLPFTVIVDVNDKNFSKELDAGRKGITERRAWQIKEKVKEILKTADFINYRKYIIGGVNRIENPLYDPKQRLINKFNKKTLHNLGALNLYLPPLEEQEVISLFHLLMHKDIIKGYTEKVISSTEVYDGLYEYLIVESEETLHSSVNTFGIDKSIFNMHGNVIKKDNIVIEYKQTLDQIFGDINSGLKNLNQIDILICWSIDKAKIDENGSIINPKSVRNNIYYGVTHVLTHSQKSNLAVIELKSLVEKYFNIAAK